VCVGASLLLSAGKAGSESEATLRSALEVGQAEVVSEALDLASCSSSWKFAMFAYAQLSDGQMLGPFKSAIQWHLKCLIDYLIQLSSLILQYQQYE
jgi:hypothetical protein